MPLTSSMEDYLEAVLIVAKKQIEVRSVDIARQLNVSKPSVWRAMTVLKDGGFLTMDDHSFLLLTDLGQETAKKIYERHCFFTEQLIAAGIDPKTAEADACRIAEHRSMYSLRTSEHRSMYSYVRLSIRSMYTTYV